MKVFGIGLHKTGTSSLNLACLILGLRSRHYFANKIPLEGLDCFFDMPIPLIFPELDRKCPGSKFIYTTRDRSQWLESCRRWFAPQEFPDADHVLNRVRECYGTHVFDEKAFGDTYDRHHERVMEYFARRPGDLLVWSVIDEPRWEPLCQFLHLPVPNEPFPHANEFRTLPDPAADVVRRIQVQFGRPFHSVRDMHFMEEAIFWGQRGRHWQIKERPGRRRLVVS
jgi:hypothetical protein